MLIEDGDNMEAENRIENWKIKIISFLILPTHCHRLSEKDFLKFKRILTEDGDSI